LSPLVLWEALFDTGGDSFSAAQRSRAEQLRLQLLAGLLQAWHDERYAAGLSASDQEDGVIDYNIKIRKTKKK
jgi:hypothetical protein